MRMRRESGTLVINRPPPAQGQHYYLYSPNAKHSTPISSPAVPGIALSIPSFRGSPRMAKHFWTQAWCSVQGPFPSRWAGLTEGCMTSAF